MTQQKLVVGDQLPSFPVQEPQEKVRLPGPGRAEQEDPHTPVGGAAAMLEPPLPILVHLEADHGEKDRRRKGPRGRPGPGLVMQIAAYFELIWDEVDELKRLAQLSHPRVPVETGGLTPKAT